MFSNKIQKTDSPREFQRKPNADLNLDMGDANIVCSSDGSGKGLKRKR